jgi:hypothetical protein
VKITLNISVDPHPHLTVHVVALWLSDYRNRSDCRSAGMKMLSLEASDKRKGGTIALRFLSGVKLCETPLWLFFPVAQQPYWGLDREATIIHTHTLQLLGLLWTRKDLYLTRYNVYRDRHLWSSRDLTRNSSKRAAAEPRLLARGHGDRPAMTLPMVTESHPIVYSFLLFLLIST